MDSSTLRNGEPSVDIKELIELQKRASSYKEWLDIGKQIDEKEHLDAWPLDDRSDIYDFKLLRSRLNELRRARLDGNVPQLLYLVRTTFSRNIGNMGDPKLYKYSHTGTKYLIEEYISECEQALQFLVSQSDHSLSSEILNVLVQTRKTFGRTALVFSGGSILGFLHAGVMRELIEQQLLPRIISGSSSGSIFASILCIHRDEEFEKMWQLLDIPMSIFEQTGQEESLITHLKRFCTLGTWIDSTYLKEMMQGLIGDITFQEAYNRTGRILNVTVSVSGSHDMQRLLNYLTAPNVVIWSAVVCSCSVPLIFAADNIFVKNPKTKEIYPWSRRSFIDGSVDNDMPLGRLSEMLNVNHFVACQVNPHIAPLFKTEDLVKNSTESSTSLRSRVFRWMTISISNGIQSVRSLLLDEVEHGLLMLKAAGIAASTASTILNVIGQEYWGDITIVPRIQWSDVGSLFKNPTNEKVKELIQRGQQATWDKLALVRNHCAIEVALDRAIVDIRSRVISSVATKMVSSPIKKRDTRRSTPDGRSYSLPSLCRTLSVSEVGQRHSSRHYDRTLAAINSLDINQISGTFDKISSNETADAEHIYSTRSLHCSSPSHEIHHTPYKQYRHARATIKSNSSTMSVPSLERVQNLHKQCSTNNINNINK